jgi:hypothetical protein
VGLFNQSDMVIARAERVKYFRKSQSGRTLVDASSKRPLRLSRAFPPFYRKRISLKAPGAEAVSESVKSHSPIPLHLQARRLHGPQQYRQSGCLVRIGKIVVPLPSMISLSHTSINYLLLYRNGTTTNPTRIGDHGNISVRSSLVTDTNYTNAHPAINHA